MNQDICNLGRTRLRQMPLELCGVSSLCIAKQEVLGTETSNRGKLRGFCTTTSSASHRQQTHPTAVHCSLPLQPLTVYVGLQRASGCLKLHFFL